jgi:hypothetical protein
MKKNMGITDKAIRLILVFIIGVLYFTNLISGTLAIVLGILGGVLMLTSFISFCPLYVFFGINTKKKESSKE